jgi:hypothetical protein
VMITIGISLLGCTVAVILKIHAMNTCPLSVGQNVGLPVENVPVQGDPGVPDVNQLEDELVSKIFFSPYFCRAPHDLLQVLLKLLKIRKILPFIYPDSWEGVRVTC